MSRDIREEIRVNNGRAVHQPGQGTNACWYDVMCGDKSEKIAKLYRCCWDLCARGELGTGKAALAGSLVRPLAVGVWPMQNTHR